jgi:DMSO/TMAO reductase YedYZ molybdopterin-dependent catalytic subunit
MASVLYAAIAGLQTLGFGAAVDDGSEAYYEDESRRQLLSRIPGLAVGGLALIVIGRVVRDAARGGVQRSTRGRPTQEVTANGDYYLVSKNLIDPQLSANSWSLHVGGFVNQKLDLRYNDLLAFQAQEQYTTMQCISNGVGGELISNALWKGVPLKTVLNRAGIQSAAQYVMFRCSDGYTESLTIDFALQDHVILAYQMNGEQLPQKHGFPVRLLSPGKYGIKHPKWITDVMLMDNETFGYWQQQGWTQEARMNTSVRIDVPGLLGEVAAGSTYLVEGLAFSGDRGISKVEVSTDNRKTWSEATLKPPLGPFTWVLWSYEWRPSQVGEYRVWARATDGTGELQTEREADPYPDGATGWHETVARVVEAM